MATTDLREPSTGGLPPRPELPSSVLRPQTPQDPFVEAVPGGDFIKLDLIAQFLAVLALFAVLKLGLLAALLSGLLVYELVHILAPTAKGIGVAQRTRKFVALSLLASIVILAVLFGILGLVSLLSRGPESVTVLLQHMADVIETTRSRLPPWAWSYLPENAEELKAVATAWLREHAGQLRIIGQDVWRVLIHVVIGMVVGGMIAVSSKTQPQDRRPLAQALTERARLLGSAFRRVVFAQVRIAAINAVLTGIYLLAILPIFGITLPLAKTMVAITFIVGLLPVLGNLISNTVIVVVSLSVSLATAICSLVFLVVIHKLEYFVNARIMGAHLGSRAWELLLAMVVMDAAFGIAGVIAAPIYYSYVKDELSARGLV